MTSNQSFHILCQLLLATSEAETIDKIHQLEEEYGIEQDKIANLILAQVNSEIQIDDLVKKLAELKDQGATTDKMLDEVEAMTQQLKRRRRSVDDPEDDFDFNFDDDVDTNETREF